MITKNTSGARKHVKYHIARGSVFHPLGDLYNFAISKTRPARANVSNIRLEPVRAPEVFWFRILGVAETSLINAVGAVSAGVFWIIANFHDQVGTLLR